MRWSSRSGSGGGRIGAFCGQRGLFFCILALAVLASGMLLSIAPNLWGQSTTASPCDRSPCTSSALRAAVQSWRNTLLTQNHTASNYHKSRTGIAAETEDNPSGFDDDADESSSPTGTTESSPLQFWRRI